MVIEIKFGVMPTLGEDWVISVAKLLNLALKMWGSLHVGGGLTGMIMD